MHVIDIENALLYTMVFYIDTEIEKCEQIKSNAQNIYEYNYAMGAESAFNAVLRAIYDLSNMLDEE